MHACYASAAPHKGPLKISRGNVACPGFGSRQESFAFYFSCFTDAPLIRYEVPVCGDGMLVVASKFVKKSRNETNGNGTRFLAVNVFHKMPLMVLQRKDMLFFLAGSH